MAGNGPPCAGAAYAPGTRSTVGGGEMRRRTATVELFEQIRREYEFGLGTIQGVARKFGVHRRLVREAVQSAVPQQNVPLARPRPRLEPVAGFIDTILEADRQAPG